MTQYTIHIPRWRPTPLNKLLSGHWSKAARLKKADKHMIWSHSLLVPKATGKRRVDLHVILGPGMRRTDVDSMWKSGLDGLVAAGMLIDDTTEWTELGSVTFGRNKAEGSTVITLTEIG